MCWGVTTAFAETNELDYTALFNASSSMQEEPLQGYTVGETVPSIKKDEITDPNMTYQSLVEAASYRKAVLLQDGEPVGSASFFEIDGEWVCTDFTFDNALSDAIQTYGSDILCIGGSGIHYVAEAESPYTLHRISDSSLAFDDADMVQTLPEYVVCMSYQNQTTAKQTDLMDGDTTAVSQETYELAKAYWEKQGVLETTGHYGWIVAVVVIVLAAGVIAGVIIKRKKNAKA